MITKLAQAESSAIEPSPDASSAGASAAVCDSLDARALADHRWLHGNYDGLGKSGVQEARDSARALGLALIASGVMTVAAFTAVVAAL